MLLNKTIACAGFNLLGVKGSLVFHWPVCICRVLEKNPQVSIHPAHTVPTHTHPFSLTLSWPLPLPLPLHPNPSCSFLSFSCCQSMPPWRTHRCNILCETVLAGLLQVTGTPLCCCLVWRPGDPEPRLLTQSAGSLTHAKWERSPDIYN